MRLDELNRSPLEHASRALERCCGARAWVERMCRARPFADREALVAQAERAADALARDDWLEAFAHHPRIGERAAARGRLAATATWAGDEQLGAASAPEAVQAALARANRAYEQRFGYVFIVCATGKSAGEMLELLVSRLSNDPDREIEVAAAEQRKITRLRLEKLLEEP